MTPYSVALTRSADRELERLPAATVRRIFDKMSALQKESRPHGCRKLEGEGELYRIRVGDYRIIYEISDSDRTVLITRIRHRREAYE